MQKHFYALILAWLVIAPAAAADALPMFDRKYFTDAGNFVGVEGSPTGEGARPDPTRWLLWCYQGSRECFQIIITASGGFVSIWTPIPITYAVQVWAADRIVAQRDLMCGLQETWLLDQLRETAEFFGATCLGKKPPPLTIEDPPSLKKLKERRGEQKPTR